MKRLAKELLEENQFIPASVPNVLFSLNGIYCHILVNMTERRRRRRCGHDYEKVE